MRREKALLPVAGHRHLLDRQLAVLAALRPIETFVSCRAGQRLPLPGGVLAIHDDGESGPLGGIVALLRAMRGDALFVLGVDLARMTPHVARRIVGAAPFDGSRGVIPRHARRLEPLAALLPRAIAPIAEAQLAAGTDLSLHALIELGANAGLVRFFDIAPADQPAFANWNFPSDRTPAAFRN